MADAQRKRSPDNGGPKPDTSRRARKDAVTEAAFLQERNRVRNKELEKTERLRALRLAKEAADRDAAAKAPAVAAPKKGKRTPAIS
jgi:hypothetical protein